MNKDDHKHNMKNSTSIKDDEKHQNRCNAKKSTSIKDDEKREKRYNLQNPHQLKMMRHVKVDVIKMNNPHLENFGCIVMKQIAHI